MLAVNTTVLTWFSVEELTLKQFLRMESEFHACRAQNYVFPSYKGVERSIAKHISLWHVLHVSFWKKADF